MNIRNNPVNSLPRWRARRMPVVWAVLASSALALAAETESAAQMEYQAFKLIYERNIFNQNRNGDGLPAAPPTTSKTPVIDSFALVGVLSGANGDMAFFEGSSSAYKKMARVSDTIADYKVAEIGIDYVQLETDGTQVQLPVGMQLERRDQGEWRQTEHTPDRSEVPTRSVNYSTQSETFSERANAFLSSRFGGSEDQSGGFFGGRNRGGGGFGFGGDGSDDGGFGDSEDQTGGFGGRNRSGNDDSGNGFGNAGNDSSGFGGRTRSGRRGRGGFGGGGNSDSVSDQPASTLSTTPSTGESEAEILQRLLQRRQQEREE